MTPPFFPDLSPLEALAAQLTPLGVTTGTPPGGEIGQLNLVGDPWEGMVIRYDPDRELYHCVWDCLVPGGFTHTLLEDLPSLARQLNRLGCAFFPRPGAGGVILEISIPVFVQGSSSALWRKVLECMLEAQGTVQGRNTWKSEI